MRSIERRLVNDGDEVVEDRQVATRVQFAAQVCELCCSLVFELLLDRGGVVTARCGQDCGMCLSP